MFSLSLAHNILFATVHKGQVIMNIKYLILLGTILSVISTPALADSKKDLETISKAISFISGGPSGAVEVAVVFDPANADSKTHADEIVALLSGGIGSKVKLTGKKIESSGISSSTSRVFFMTRGSKTGYDSALAKAKENKGITTSTDTTCLDANACVLVVKTKPSVDIFVSTKAAETTGTSFAAAFAMMITKK